MRICAVIYGSLDTLTGGYLYDKKVVRHLRAAGHTVDIFSLQNRSYFRNVFHNWNGNLIEFISDTKPDIVLIDELCHPSVCFVSGKISRKFGIPVLSIVHLLKTKMPGKKTERWLASQLEPAFLRSMDGIIAISRKTVDQVQELAGCEFPHIVAYPAGDRFPVQITEDQIREKIRTSDKFRILVLGNLTPRKNALAVLQACRGFSAEDIHITFAGDPDADIAYSKRLKKFIHKHSMESLVQFSGSVRDPGKIADLLRTTHLLVLPSFAEGYPLVHVEAAGLGVPSIATTHSSVDELIEHGKNGYLADPRDIRGIRSYIESVLVDRAKLKDLSIHAYRSFEEHPTWEETGETVLHFLTNFTRE